MHLYVSLGISYRPISRHISGKAFMKRTGYKSPATVDCAPDGKCRAVMWASGDSLRDTLPIASASLSFISLGACPSAPHPGDVRIA